MADQKRVAIILINYNNYSDTIECLESLFKLNYRWCNIIVIDSHSANDSFEIMTKWLKREPSGDVKIVPPRDAVNFATLNWRDNKFSLQGKEAPSCDCPLVLIESFTNLGFTGANNLGATFAAHYFKPEYFWFLNNDTTVEEDSLSALVDTATSDKIGAVGSKILDYDRREYIQYLGGAMLTAKGIVNPYRGKKDFPVTDSALKGYITGSSFLVTKEVVDKVGLWDENLFMYLEDFDYCRRIRMAGYKLYLSALSRVYHKERKGIKKEETIKNFLGKRLRRVGLERFNLEGYYIVRNMIYLGKKNHQLPFRGIYYFCAAVIVVVLLDDNKIKRLKVLLRALADGFAGRMGLRHIII